jgi:hypothetical protein
MSIEDMLDADLRWRESELASLKRLAITSSGESVAYKGMLRALWALLYAHFEGFTKFCWDSLLDHVQAEGIPKKDLDRKFALLALEGEFRGLRGDMAPESVWRFFNEVLPSALEVGASFPEESRLSADSNLWPNVFERESSRIGITCEELEKHRTLIKTLVARRNEIAHGKEMVISSVADYGIHENAVLCLMHELAIKVIEVADARAYCTSVV